MYDITLITGLPGVGKTTIAKQLAKTIPKSAYISADELRKNIIGGYKNPTISPWDEETRKQYYLAFENEADLAKNYLKAGFKIIIDDVIHPGDLYKKWKKYFIKFNYKIVFLTANKKILLQRNKERLSHHVSNELIDRLYKDFNQYDFSDWIVIDNSNLTIKETLSQLKN